MVKGGEENLTRRRLQNRYCPLTLEMAFQNAEGDAVGAKSCALFHSEEGGRKIALFCKLSVVKVSATSNHASFAPPPTFFPLPDASAELGGPATEGCQPPLPRWNEPPLDGDEAQLPPAPLYGLCALGFLGPFGFRGDGFPEGPTCSQP